MSPEADMAYLARLRFVTRKRRRGGTWGERRTTRRGTGLEFTDYRDYTPGDDPRRVDWNLYARLDRPYIRLYEAEEDLSITILVDNSGSMHWTSTEPEASTESPKRTRWEAAQELSSALGTLVLLSGDLLHGALLHQQQALQTWGPRRGRGYIPQWHRWCNSLAADISPDEAPRYVDIAPRRSGLLLLLTDGYNMEGLATGINTWAGRGHEVILLHLLTPEEVNPALRGDLKLVDSETEGTLEVTLDAAALDAYQRRFERWQDDLRNLTGKHGGRYALVPTEYTTKRVFLEILRHAGIVR